MGSNQDLAEYLAKTQDNLVQLIALERTLNEQIINSKSTMTIGELFNESISVKEFKDSYDYWFYNLLGDPCTRYILTIPELRYKKVFKGDFTGKGYFDNSDIKFLAKYLVNDVNTLNEVSQLTNFEYKADFIDMKNK